MTCFRVLQLLLLTMVEWYQYNNVMCFLIRFPCFRSEGKLIFDNAKAISDRNMPVFDRQDIQ